VWSNNTITRRGSLITRGREDLNVVIVEPPAKTCNCFRLTKKLTCDPPSVSIDQRFRLLPHYSGVCCSYDLTTRDLTGSVRLYGMAHSGDDYLYSTGRGYVDLAADETGVWVIYAAAGDHSHMLVARLDTEMMSVTGTWSIAVRHADYGNGFVVCGVLYLVHDETARHGAALDFAYDLHDRRHVEVHPDVTFTSPYQLTTALAYNARDQRLYAWDNGNQLTYPLLV